METMNSNQIDEIMKHYPDFELSYESMLHNKVPNKYDLVFAIPTGKKYIIWFTFFRDENVLVLFELSKDKRLINGSFIPFEYEFDLVYNTIFYGVYLSEIDSFVIEDIHYYKGINISKLILNEKMYYILKFLKSYNKHQGFLFHLPVFWKNNNLDPSFPIQEKNKISYQIHHLQYRSLYEIVPYLNYNLNQKNEKSRRDQPIYIPIRCDFRKPQYKQNSVFLISADIQYDIYHLFVYGKNNSRIYYNIACIPDYKTSVFMNDIFRKIKENKNLDFIEESDDEEDFQDTKEDKYVDLQKIIQMECVFHSKFKRWIPKRIVRNQRIVHISQL